MEPAEPKPSSAGSVARVPAADIEAVVVKLLKEHLATKQDRSTTSNVLSEDRGAVAQLVAGYPLVVSEWFRGFFKWFRGFLKMASSGGHQNSVPLWKKPAIRPHAAG